MALYRDLNSAPGWKWSVKVKLSAASLTALKRFWLQLNTTNNIGKGWGISPLTSVCDLTISMDASKLAWGAYLYGHKTTEGAHTFNKAC